MELSLLHRTGSKAPRDSQDLTATWQGILLRLLAEAEGREGATLCSVSVTHDRKHFCEHCCLRRRYTKTWRGFCPLPLISTSLPKHPHI